MTRWKTFYKFYEYKFVKITRLSVNNLSIITVVVTKRTYYFTKRVGFYFLIFM